MSNPQPLDSGARNETPDPAQPHAARSDPRSLVLAGRAVRFASLCYEALLLVPVVFLAAYLFTALAQDASAIWFRPLLRLWLLLVLAAYFLYCWTMGGQTLAMRTWRLRLIMANGTRMKFKAALARYVFAVCGVLLAGIGFWWSFFDRDRQFLHDRLADTRLARAPADEREHSP